MVWYNFGMFWFFISNLEKGIKKIASNPQLIYTVVVAVLITGSFVFMADGHIINDVMNK